METQLTVFGFFLRLGLFLRACEAGGRGLHLYQLNECFIKHQLHTRMFCDAVIINHTNCSFGSPVCKRQSHPWLSSQPAAWSGPALSCLSPQVVHTNATVCLSLLESFRNNKPHLITRALHGCMITVLCMVEVCWRQKHYMVGVFERGICSLWLPHRVICCASR